MKFIPTLTMLLAITLSGSFVHASGKTIIYIETIGKAEFEIIYHRATSNATGVVIAGLIGAGIQAGVESSKDASKAGEIQPMIEKDSWKVYFLDTLNKKLESKNYEAKWIDSDEKLSGGLMLKIYPDNYGFKIVDTTTMLMSAYVDFNVTLTNLDIRESEGKKKNFYITSRDRRSFADFSSNKVLLNTDLQAALTKAAKRVANKIIYNKEV